MEGFTRVGYPQQLRIILGIVKPLGVIALLVPGFVKLKEWAYAGFTFAWICAVVAHFSVGQKSRSHYSVGVVGAALCFLRDEAGESDMEGGVRLRSFDVSGVSV